MLKWLTSESDSLRYVQAGFWRNQTLHEIIDLTSERSANKVAVADDTQALTYEELSRKSRRMASLLYDLGLRRKDVLAVIGENSVVLPLLHLAASRIGAAFLTMPSMWGQNEVIPTLSTAKTSILVINDPHTQRLNAVVDSVKRNIPILDHVIRAEDLFERMVDYPEIDSGGLPMEPHPDLVSTILTSSGTTGSPKLSALSSNNLTCQFLTQVAPTAGFDSSHEMAAIAPINTGSTGYFYGVLMPLLTGASTRILNKWTAEGAIQLLKQERVSAVTVVPTQIFQILEHIDTHEGVVPQIEILFSSGAALPAPVASRAMDTLGCIPFPIYGSSESTIPTVLRRDDSEEKKLTTVGCKAPGQELYILNEAGEVVPDGTVGEIIWRGPNNSYGFYNQPQLETGAWDSDGFFHSGDAGLIDSDGYLKVVGRYKDMILRGGHNIFPSEIESMLLQHPQVQEVAIVGVPDEKFGERCCAIIVPHSGAVTPGLDDVTEFLEKRGMAKYKFPEYVLAVSTLPRTAASKVDKQHLRDFATKEILGGAAPSSRLKSRYPSREDLIRTKCGS